MRKTHIQIIIFLIITVLLLSWPAVVFYMNFKTDITLGFKDEVATAAMVITFAMLTLGVMNFFYFIMFRTGLDGEGSAFLAGIKNIFFWILTVAAAIVVHFIYFADTMEKITNPWLVGVAGMFVVSTAVLPLAYMVLCDYEGSEIFMPFLVLGVMVLSFCVSAAIGAIGLKAPVFYKLTVPVLSIGCLFILFTHGMPFDDMRERKYSSLSGKDDDYPKEKPKPTPVKKTEPDDENRIEYRSGGNDTVRYLAHRIFPEAPHTPCYKNEVESEGEIVADFFGGAYRVNFLSEKIMIEGKCIFRTYRGIDGLSSVQLRAQSDFMSDYMGEEFEILNEKENEFMSEVKNLYRQYDDLYDNYQVEYKIVKEIIMYQSNGEGYNFITGIRQIRP